MVLGNFSVIDAHCHIYPEKIAAKAVAGTDRFYDTVAKCRGTVADLISVGTEAGVDHMIVQSVATTPKQVTGINEFIAATVAESAGRMTGLGTLHPDSEDLAGDVRRILSLGLKGVKLHPDIQAFKIDDYRFLKIYELCEQEGLPILMHTGDSRYDYSNPNRLLPVMQIFTGLTVIGAHMGGWSLWENAVEELSPLPNLYVDCSSSLPYMTKEAAVRVMRRYGTHRVLFGTDYPMWDPREELESFLSLDLTDTERADILSRNAQRLFSISLK
ncbi:MAG: amidohydrolase [Clostridia bacterium]|nr:amidohydrolase [Clostridia bacterium]MBR2926490.1 amidohydrolase [Clostridia bacterium]